MSLDLVLQMSHRWRTACRRTLGLFVLQNHAEDLQQFQYVSILMSLESERFCDCSGFTLNRFRPNGLKKTPKLIGCLNH